MIVWYILIGVNDVKVFMILVYYFLKYWEIIWEIVYDDCDWFLFDLFEVEVKCVDNIMFECVFGWYELWLCNGEFLCDRECCVFIEVVNY